MCEICRQSPCDARCPNAPAPIPVFVCSGCSQDIYEGDDYWDVFGEQFCESCIDDTRITAEHDLICFICEEVICEGEDFFEIMGRSMCEHCISDARREAIFDDEAE